MASFADKNVSKEEEAPDPALKTIHFLLLEKKIESLSALGSVLIAGIEGDDEEDDEEEDDEDDDVCYTAEQIRGLRHIIITKNREKEIERSTNRFGGGDDCIAMFDTQTGNEAIHYIPIVLKRSMKKKTLSERFDALFAMTYALNYFDTWMVDNEEYGAGVVAN
jgi:hypothetical protein